MSATAHRDGGAFCQMSGWGIGFRLVMPECPPGPIARKTQFFPVPQQSFHRFVWFFKNSSYLCIRNGGLAQLARALAWHARGHEFESRILHFDPRQIGAKRRQIPQNQGFAGFSFSSRRHPKDTKKPRSDKVALLKPLLKRLWDFSNDLRRKSLICRLLS